MDLRMCPSCQQSVLDDDVQECPFCGAAMDGSSPAPQAKAPPKGQKPVPRKDIQKASKPESAPEKRDDDPFAVETKVNKQVIALRRKPTAKANHRIICPMCDSSGFATPAVAGKEVKCPNPKCLMPIFTAPEIKKEEPKVEKKPIFTPALIGGMGGGAVIIGILIYFFVLQAPPTPAVKPIVEPDKGTIKEGPVEKKPVEIKQPPKISIAKLKEQILKENEAAVLQRTNNRSKPFCRQLSAEAFAELGNIESALYQLKKLDDLRSGLSFFKITPLVRISWHHLENGDREAARKVAEQAWELAKSFPNRGNDAIPHTVFLGTLLVSLEEYEKAQSLILSREKVQKANLTSVRSSLIFQDQTYDLNQNYQWLPLLDLDAPMSFATAYGATVRGYDQQTVSWINTLTSPSLKGNALAGYAVARCITNPTADALADFGITGMTQQDKQRAVAMSLQVKNYQQKTEQASAILTQLQKETAAWKIPAPLIIPDFKGIYKGEYKQATREVFIAMQTHRLIARHLASNNQLAPAWQHIEKAFAWAAAVAPSRQQTASLSSKMQKNRLQIQSELAREFKITQTVNQRNAFNKYRNQVRQIESDTTKRFDLETALLRDALKWGLATELYQSYQQELPTQKKNSNLKQAVEESLLSDLVFSLESAKNLQAASQLREKFASRIKPQAPLKTRLELQRLIDAGSIKQARTILEREKENLIEPQLEIRIASKIAQNSPPHNTLEWINSIPDVIRQELAFQLTATLASKRGLIREYWKACSEQSLSATKKCSVHLGLTEGLMHTDLYKKEISEKQTGDKDSPK